LFVLSYMMANHFPWNTPWRRTWCRTGRTSQRQRRWAQDRRIPAAAGNERACLQGFVERLKSKFPGEPFLIVRFGDHQPMFSKHVIEAGSGQRVIGRRIDAAILATSPPTTPIDALNFQPADLKAAVSGLDAAYLPLVVLEAAGVPLDATFVEQKRILGRCNGQFYSCANGAKCAASTGC